MAGDTFQKLKSSFNRGVTAISVKTSSSLEKVKIKTHIESINSEIEALIFSAGKIAYVAWESNETDDLVLFGQFSAIKQKKDEVAQLEAEYLSIDERDDQILGTSSADKAPALQSVAEQVEGAVCPNCGSSYSSLIKFCRKCGYKLQE